MSLALVSLIISCDFDESDSGDLPINISDVTGQYVVEIERDGVHFDYNTISIYNTSANDKDLLWLDDQEHGWGLKAKVPLNYEAKTFGGNDLEETYYDVTVNITEGVFIKNGTTAPSGTLTDSIYFKAEFSDIPGEIWEYYGFKSTAKVEDLP